MSEVATTNEDYENAQRLAQEALAYAEGDGTPQLVLWARFHLGWALCCVGAYDDSIAYLRAVLQEDIVSANTVERLQSVAAFALAAAHRQQLERAAELLGLIFQYPVQVASLTGHPKLTALRQALETQLESERFAAAWVRGQAYDLVGLVTELLEEFREA